MAIDGIGGAGPIRTARRTGTSASPSGFSVAVRDTGGSEAAPTSGPLAVGMETMLTLQEQDSDDGRDLAGRRHGQSLLAGLASLQRVLLAGQEGEVGPVLTQLTHLLSNMPAVADPGLATVLAAIRLRAKVELARVC